MGRTIALCYIRRSWVRDDKDLVSPEIQRQANQAICDAHGWTPEWFVDADGHRSGMTENRPEWQRLKLRIHGPDVAALVTYDLSRLHRKGWRVSQLLDQLDKDGIRLVISNPGKSIDFSTPQGRFFAQMSAIFDEYYAVDVSQRRKANAAHKKSLHKTVGIPPFGTKRDKDGYLIPSDEGAWLLPDGRWHPGIEGEDAPDSFALWRGYYACAGRILALYAAGKGMSAVCATMRGEGWAFRSRANTPVLLENDAVRRVIRNWIEYGGIVVGQRAKDRPAWAFDPSTIELNPARAVFDTGLLKRVGYVSRERSFRMPDNGKSAADACYPLGSLVYCAHCDEIAIQQHDPRLRRRLIGKGRKGNRAGSYRHRAGRQCGCAQKQVYAPLLESEFVRLCGLLSLDETAFGLLKDAALAFSATTPAHQDDFERTRSAKLAKAERKLVNARFLFENADIEQADYLGRKHALEDEIARLRTMTTDAAQLHVQLMACVEALSRLVQLWVMASDEDKQQLARGLFDELVYDLDAEQIVDFKLKPWATQFLIVRGELYRSERYSNAPSRNRTCAFASGGQRSIR